MKKAHKTKPRKTAAKPARAHGAQAAPLVAHSTRRAPTQSRPDPRRQHPARRNEPATIYRRPNPLLIDSRDDRQAFRLLLLPFFIMALVIAIVPALHNFPTLKDLIAQTPHDAARPVADVVQMPALAPVATETANAEVLAPLGQPAVRTAATPRIALPPARAAEFHSTTVAALPPAHSVAANTHAPEFDTLQAPAIEALSWQLPPSQLAEREPARARMATASPQFSGLVSVAPLLPSAPAVAPPAVSTPRQTVAMLAPPRSPNLLLPIPPAPYETSCPVTYASAAAPADDLDEGPAASAPFGERLAVAAVSQLKHFVIYDDKYRQISRAGGDVPALYGVCTDVVIRAYRALGVDLQTLVQASRLGAGDPNIDHRRTETLRRFLARYGQTLPITPFGEDYLPGDIVTYWRPQNSGSRSHIAVVAAERGPSGRPMIIHNRGWGPQMEDGLFVDRITGHYRYDGANRPPLPPQLATSPARPFAVTSPATPITLRTTGSVDARKPNGL
ncbi:MAG: DUF1287 domain-containing protein [Hyphomicrobiaceae bacterium]|nr:DUF1287 domain-containing protein [Hyphomicrobiaceae bacterium]